MKWECAECRAVESDDVRVEVVCHHCGKPLCQDHRVAIADPAFHAERPDPRIAYHCAACKKLYHS